MKHKHAFIDKCQEKYQDRSAKSLQHSSQALASYKKQTYLKITYTLTIRLNGLMDLKSQSHRLIHEIIH